MTCKDCIHSGLCYKENDYDNFPNKCGDFVLDEIPQGDLISQGGMRMDKEMTPKCTGEFHDPFSKMLNEAGKREFIKIVSRYVPDEICPYEEYKGKPYYSILYRENGEEFEGYSTYSLDILSDFLKCYFFGNGEEVVGNGLYNLDTSSEREETKMEERVKGGETK